MAANIRNINYFVDEALHKFDLESWSDNNLTESLNQTNFLHIIGRLKKDNVKLILHLCLHKCVKIIFKNRTI